MKPFLRINLRWAIFLPVFFLNASALLAQHAYYVSATGNDALAGTSTATAWKTLAKVNGTALSNGDSILLKRGDKFTGILRVKYSGVTVDAYGSGNKPIITGAEQITTTWTTYSGNIWQTTFSSLTKPADIRGLYKSENPLPISRYPNKSVNNGYLNFESHSGITQFTDNQLTGTPSWTGSDVVVRAERFRLVKTKVSTHSGSTITIPSLTTIDQLRDGYGYFFVNNVNAIDLDGEWSYSATTGKVLLYSTSNPSTAVTFLRTDTTLSIENANNVTVKNVQLKYARLVCLSLKNGSSLLVDNVDISRSGSDGVAFSGVTYSTFSNNTITDVNWSGIISNATCNNIAFTGNTISHIGNEANGKSKTFIGIDCNSPNCQIQDNKITRTGYSGIISAGINNLVKHNVIDSACYYLEDNGGIYTNGNIGVTTGTVIDENIITNSFGERLGAPAATSLANGIYIDNFSQGVTVKNNTVAFVNGEGLFIGSVQTGIEVSNNTSFQSGLNEMQIYHPLAAPGFVITGNILVSNSLAVDHDVFKTISTDDYSYAQLGLFKYNNIINPFNDKAITFNYRADDGPKTQRYTPYEWEASVVQVNGTVPAVKKYPSGTIPANVIKFYYNNTSSSQPITLPFGLYTTVYNQAYCGTFSLPAYKSVVLFRVDSVACVTPGSCGAPDSLHISSIRDTSAVLHWSVTGGINSDVRYRPVGSDTTWKYAYNVQADSVKLLSLKSATDYECAVRNSCYGSESSWVNYNGFTTLVTSPPNYQFKFVNATYANCSPDTAFASVETTTDNKWTLVNSSGTGTVDKDFMRSNAGTENAPVIKMTVDSVLDICNTYDVYLYYLSPTTQTWKTRARMADSTTFKLFDRTTAGAVLLPDYTGTTTSNRLFRAKLGRVSGVNGFSVYLDDSANGSTSKTVFDGLGYIQVSDEHPIAPGSLDTTSVSSGSVALQWLDLSSNETSFIVERKSGSSPFTLLATLPAGTTTFTDTTATPGTYIYRVADYAITCKSLYSNQLTVVVPDMGSLRSMQSTSKTEKDTVSVIKAPFNTDHLKLDKQDQKVLKIYPNPSNGNFNIDVSNFSATNNNIKVIDVRGKTLVDRNLPKGTTSIHINISNQMEGIYIVKLKCEGTEKVFYTKLLKN
ncbi:MAG: T9SS type A sorting domain-containing protein [Mucilaginibacter sp.]|uniref:T9SS type A sorting domain-containing protein n=1 Tax=Mucilaginibacter sp. TaxID=1882438 RepID=UPI0032668FF8